MKEDLKQQATAGVSLTTDAWTSRATQSYITTTASFIDSQWELVEYVLDTQHVPGSHDAEKLAEVLQQVWYTTKLNHIKII